MPSPFVRVVGVCACVLVVALCLIVIGLTSLSVCGRLFCWSALCLSWSLGDQKTAVLVAYYLRSLLAI